MSLFNYSVLLNNTTRCKYRLNIGKCGGKLYKSIHTNGIFKLHGVVCSHHLYLLRLEQPDVKVNPYE